MNQDVKARCALLCAPMLCTLLLSLAVGCAASASVRREEELKRAGEQQLQERESFRTAVEQYLRDTEALRRNGLKVVLVAGRDPVVPRPECTDYGCPTAVMCEAAKAICYVTHCGKGDAGSARSQCLKRSRALSSSNGVRSNACEDRFGLERPLVLSPASLVAS
jgi:hypothetical protein